MPWERAGGGPDSLMRHSCNAKWQLAVLTHYGKDVVRFVTVFMVIILLVLINPLIFLFRFSVVTIADQILIKAQGFQCALRDQTRLGTRKVLLSARPTPHLQAQRRVAESPPARAARLRRLENVHGQRFLGLSLSHQVPGGQERVRHDPVAPAQRQAAAAQQIEPRVGALQHPAQACLQVGKMLGELRRRADPRRAGRGAIFPCKGEQVLGGEPRARRDGPDLMVAGGKVGGAEEVVCRRAVVGAEAKDALDATVSHDVLAAAEPLRRKVHDQLGKYFCPHFLALLRILLRCCSGLL